MWRKGNPHTALVGMKTDATTVENSIEKLKIELPYNPTILLLGTYSKKTKTLIQKDMHPYIHCKFQDMEATINRWMDKEDMVHIYNGILFTNKKEQILVTSSEVTSEKAMAPHSSTLAWRIPWTEEPGGLQPMGSQGVGHKWATKQQQWPWTIFPLAACQGRSPTWSREDPEAWADQRPGFNESLSAPLRFSVQRMGRARTWRPPALGQELR